MTEPTRTPIGMPLDRSGSMESITSDIEGRFSAFGTTGDQR